LALCQFRIREVISAKISTLMNTTLLNNRAKYGAKTFRCYQVITFYVLGHFFSRTLYIVERIAHRNPSIATCSEQWSSPRHDDVLSTLLCPARAYTSIQGPLTCVNVIFLLAWNTKIPIDFCMAVDMDYCCISLRNIRITFFYYKDT